MGGQHFSVLKKVSEHTHTHTHTHTHPRDGDISVVRVPDS